MKTRQHTGSEIVLIPIKKVLKKEDKNQDNSNNEFRCNKCKKVFSFNNNSVEYMQNFNVMLLKHFQNECVKNVEKHSDNQPEKEIIDQDNHEVEVLENEDEFNKIKKEKKQKLIQKNKNACPECGKKFMILVTKRLLQNTY